MHILESPTQPITHYQKNTHTDILSLSFSFKHAHTFSRTLAPGRWQYENNYEYSTREFESTNSLEVVWEFYHYQMHNKMSVLLERVGLAYAYSILVSGKKHTRQLLVFNFCCHERSVPEYIRVIIVYCSANKKAYVTSLLEVSKISYLRRETTVY